jgi:hypothetical protein
VIQDRQNLPIKAEAKKAEMFGKGSNPIHALSVRAFRASTMKPHHAITLALVGWYLMVPPSKLSATNAYKQSLNRWQVVQGFDTADGCEDFRLDFFQSARQERTLGVLNPAYRDYMFAQCVATDDPRLRAR